MERETDEGAAKKPDIGAERETRRKRSQKRQMERERLPSPAGQAVRPGRRLPVGRRYLCQRKRLWLQSLWSSGRVLKGGFFRCPFHWRFPDRGAF